MKLKDRVMVVIPTVFFIMFLVCGAISIALSKCGYTGSIFLGDISLLEFILRCYRAGTIIFAMLYLITLQQVQPSEARSASGT